MKKFMHEGMVGFVSPYNGGAFIFWGGWGFHLTAVACPDLRAAILNAMGG